MSEHARVQLVDLSVPERPRAVPILVESFEGIYRWHAKRTLRDVSEVRGALVDGALAGVSMLEMLTPEVGYVYYLAVATAMRREGVGGRLLDDALDRFAGRGARVCYAAVGADNDPSIALFRSRGFRTVERKETSYLEGGLGAWGLRSRMRLVYGEILLGRRLEPTGASRPASREPNLVPPASDSKKDG